MANIRFILKEPNVNKETLKEPKGNKETLIYLIYYFPNNRLKYSTGEIINPIYWNSSTQRAIVTKKENNDIELLPIIKEKNKSINIQLNRYVDKVEGMLTDWKKQKIVPDNKILKLELDKEFKKEIVPANKPLTFLEYIPEYIKTSNKKEGSKKANRVTLKHLLSYKKNQKKRLDFENINLDFYDDFVKYMKERNYSLNSIGGHIKTIKVFMNNAADRGLHSNKDYLNKRFKVMTEKTETIYLTDGELQRLYELDLSQNRRLEKVRDLFLIGCWTGLRFSDLKQITPENITDKGQMIRLKTIKTGEFVVIPLHWTVKEILKKYDNDVPRVISNQKMNDYLKELGKFAGINENVRLSKTTGGMRVNSNFKKYELMTVHTARRSFATNMYLQDIPSISIMKVTGHQTERAFLTYIKISQEDNAKKLLKHQYFMKPLKIAN